LPAYGPELDLLGVQHQVVFHRDGRSFAEQSATGRTRFAIDLAAQIRRRILGQNGYRPL
jgi:hypothetical protein